MSSRVLRSSAAAGATAVEWRSAGSDRARQRGLDAPRAAREPPAGDGEPAVQARLDAARQQGRSEGEAAGLARAAQRLDAAIANLTAATQELSGQRARLRAEAEEDTVKLAVAIARRVLHRELATDPEAILGLVKAAFQKLNARETHRLRVSPADAAILQENRARLEFPPRVEISADASLRPGSALFETSRGELDASVDTQMAEIERGLADLVRKRTP